MNCDNIARKIFNYRKKIESISPEHYRIVLSHRTKLAHPLSQNVFDAIAIPGFNLYCSLARVAL